MQGFKNTIHVIRHTIKEKIKKIKKMKRIFPLSLPLLLSISLFLCSCKKDVIQKVIYDNTIYGVTPVNLYSSNADKTKQKSPEQFVSILYSNLTNQTIPADALNHIAEVNYSFGDKG